MLGPEVPKEALSGLDFNQAAKYADFVFLCGWLIAEDPARPTWNEHDFFGDHYAHKM